MRYRIGFMSAPLDYATAFSDTLNLSGNGWAGFTVRSVIKNAVITSPSDVIKTVRITFKSSASSAMNFTSVYIGHLSGSQGFAATPVQILFSGSGSVNIAQNSSAVCDPIPFTYDKTSGLVIAMYGPTTVGYLRRTVSSNAESWSKNALDTTTTSTSGYSNITLLHATSLIEFGS